MGDSEFKAKFCALVGSRPFWVVPRRKSAAQSNFSCAVDFVKETLSDTTLKERVQFVRGQLKNRFLSVLDDVDINGSEIIGPDGAHLVGCGIVRSEVEEDYAFWRRILSSRLREALRPRIHIASAAAAIANLYALVAPQEVLRPSRILVVDGRSTINAVVMKGWRLIDAVEYQRMEGEVLSQPLVAQWIDYVRSQHETEDIAPEPLVLTASAEKVDGMDTWNPFAGPNVSEESSGLLSAISEERSMAMAVVAFGMALQGGI